MITSLSQWDKVVGRGLAEEKKSEINLYFQNKGMNGYFVFALAVSKVFFFGPGGGSTGKLCIFNIFPGHNFD